MYQYSCKISPHLLARTGCRQRCAKIRMATPHAPLLCSALVVLAAAAGAVRPVTPTLLRANACLRSPSDWNGEAQQLSTRAPAVSRAAAACHAAVSRAAVVASVRRAPPPVLLAKPPPRSSDFSLTDEDGQLLVGSAVVVGALTGVVVAAFKSSIAFVVATCYSGDAVVQAWSDRKLGDASVLIPAAGGLAVAALRLTSPRGKIGPGLAEHVAEVERSVPLRPEAAARRGAAAIATLGTGSALGPEGPSVELGVAISRLVGGIVERTRSTSSSSASTESDASEAASEVESALRRQRELIAAGAAAGVAAGFNAPLAGVFFALEVVSEAVRNAVVPDALPADAQAEEAQTAAADEYALAAGATGYAMAAGAASLPGRRAAAELAVKSKEAISATVISALVAALVCQEILGQELSLRPGEYNLRSALVELPLYVGLGALSGGVALLFESASTASRDLFNKVPYEFARPILGGLACGLIGLAFPQVLFFGYSTLNAILEAGDAPGSADSLDVLGQLAYGLSGGVATPERLQSFGGPLVLLLAKLLATSVCLGAGLVGGTFAPSLFFGAVLGVCYQAAAGGTLAQLADSIAAYQTSIGVEVGSWGVIPKLTVADAPAYALIGAAATLSSVFRAPLTASLLVFEQTKGYDIVLPLLAATGTGPLIVDYARRRAATPAPTTPPVQLVTPPDDCEVDAPPVCEEAPFVLVTDECEIDNRLAACVEPGDEQQDASAPDEGR